MICDYRKKIEYILLQIIYHGQKVIEWRLSMVFHIYRPSRIHQETLSELHRQIANFLVGKECKVYPAPFHVVLNLEGESDNELNSMDVFEPDITIICDKSK